MKRTSEAVSEELSEEERKLYDRQIRLWGLDAQKRLNKFRVCIAGEGRSLEKKQTFHIIDLFIF